MHIVILAFLLATTKFLLMCKFMPMKKLLYYDKWIDLFFTLLLPMVFYGTFSGMVTAVFSGMFLSIYLFVAKKIIGCTPPKWAARHK